MAEAAHEHSADHLSWAHPVVREWFYARFGSATEPQEQAWPEIVQHRSTLIAAPTGSGKTFAAFLACIDSLFRRAVSGRLADETEVIYVSPLKALSNDVHKNLEAPLQEICALAQARGFEVSPIRVALRTGDTLQTERRAILKHPPHILVTTPESLYILLTAEKSRQILRTVTTLIVDEIHAVADDKRGAHLSLSIERLEVLTDKKLVRVGLSATQKPIEMVAEFLTGAGRESCAVVDVGHKREMDLAVEVPESPLSAIASNDTWEQIHARLVDLVEKHKSTLIFVNTRKVAERLTMNLAAKLGEEQVAAHHGSLSRKLRLDAEDRLKAGKLKAIVATSSLELGIDVGDINLVCQVGSPRSIAVALQRIGRAGHWRGAISKGRLFPTTRDDLVECAGLLKAISESDLDRLVVPDAPLDILCQQIIASCSADEWREDDLYKMVRHSYPYRYLSRDRFDELLDMLSEGIVGERGRYGAYLFRDRVTKRVKARRGGRLAAITSGGAIPDTGNFNVVAEPEGLQVGTLDEDFAIESHKGDVILLGNTSWRIRRIEGRASRIVVEDAHGAPPTVPFWMGEAPARTPELSRQLSAVRTAVNGMLPVESIAPIKRSPDVGKDALSWLKQNCYVDDYGAEQIIDYILEGRQVLKTVPSDSNVVIERFFDESGGMQVVVHAPFGAKVTKAWGLALRRALNRAFHFELQSAATDNGITISLPDQISFPLSDIINFLQPATIEKMVLQSALQSPVFTTRFRWDATRALALLRFSGGKKVPPQIQRMKADDLLTAVFPRAHEISNAEDEEFTISLAEALQHPLIREVIHDVLHEAMDVDALKGVLNGIESGEINIVTVDTPLPSLFSHEILSANPYAFLDDAPLAERRARAVSMRRILPADMVEEIGLLDEEAIRQISEECAPDIRDLDELHDLLYSVVALPVDLSVWKEFIDKSRLPDWSAGLRELEVSGRACRFSVDENSFWTCPERADAVSEIYRDCKWQTSVIKLFDLPKLTDAPLTFMLANWLSHLGPTSASQLSKLLVIDVERIGDALLELERRGAILRGTFAKSAGAEGETQWCDRRILSRIHRLTVSTRRAQVEPITSAVFLQWLTYWHHVASGAQVTGDRGLLEVISQLQGYEAPAISWEREILQRRVHNYDGDWLDKLCLTGSVGWGRFSPHPALLEGEDGTSNQRRRIVPTSVAPVTFFVREESNWMGIREHAQLPDSAFSYAAQATYKFLAERGASFFADIARGTSLLKAEIETALWELVAGGAVTADGFDNLRSLINPKRRAGSRSLRGARPRNAAGRWSLLHTDNIERASAIDSICWILLKRYGIVFREILANETNIPKWRDLLQAFRRLEDRGEVAGGRFLSGFVGEQFALTEAVESIRGFKRQPQLEYRLLLSAVDPLNLSGIVSPGERIAAKPGRAIILQNGKFEPG